MTKDGNEFWPDGIRLVVSISMQFEVGGQPLKGTDSPFPAVDFPDSVASDAAANKEPGLVDRRGNYSNGGGSPFQACFVFGSTASVNIRRRGR
jgi:hypothetical protein